MRGEENLLATRFPPKFGCCKMNRIERSQWCDHWLTRAMKHRRSQLDDVEALEHSIYGLPVQD